MANVRKSIDGRKRARTTEYQYIDSQVDINDAESSQSNIHIGQRIHAQFDLSMSVIDETKSSIRPTPKLKKRESEQSFLQRQMSDIALNRFANETNRTTTELKGRDHVLRVMKTTTTTTNKPVMELKNHKFIQEMIAKRQEKQAVNRPISDFALKYGLIDNNGKKSKSRKTSELITDMAHQLDSLKPSLTKRSIINPESPLLKIVKIEPLCNKILCYCQYVTDREDLVLFLDPTNEQTKNLSVNDEIRIGGDSRLDMNIPELGSVTLGITDIRKESVRNHEEEEEDEEIPMEITHTFDFNCSCNTCTYDGDDRVLTPTFDLRSTFSDHEENQSVEPVYDSFTFGLMCKRKFDLRASIIIYNPDKLNNQYIFIVRDGIGNCLEIILNHVDELPIEIQCRNYIFHEIEFLERIESPKESNRWPYDDYAPPKKLFCFRSVNNQVSIL